MSEVPRVAVTGATGRMGGELLALASAREDLDLVLAVSRSAGDENEDTEEIEGVPIGDADALGRLLVENDVDVLVDFTAPGSSAEYVAACADAEVAAVVGTTGFSEDEEATLHRASESVPVLKASNFSRGIAALRRAVREAVAALPGFDVEVTETHHNGKRDAPSGTANTILDDIDELRSSVHQTSSGDIDEGRGDHPRVHGREGDQPREAGEIGVHARRAGGIPGEHDVLLGGDHEYLSLSHTALDRGVFADGALDAAVWLSGREAGWYDFGAVINDEE
ncbi:4-hydroxy-tetrahydrodipicolinate reductase [Salinigranum rubrum]|uniref:4-hydroxy-tetrahydrodipicolinate reductase n=1 Tax=Salinigranum rubrum TaxID=755307 RepID=A0A2I8VHP3_9EURY|nr:4-hydroxy-tetrahydrodipicolinate reductase [Salinigranum rubrum]AUV81448.1 4-hydroxy-tetrahydrodipicolinate reductase [Salinigranum rubrum]